MLRPLDDYFLQQAEPVKSCMQFLRQYILQLDVRISEEWKYRMPFYCYNGKMMCYLWVHKKYKQPYIGIVEGELIDHPALIKENRNRMKILLLDAGADLPMDTIDAVLQSTIGLCSRI